MPVLTTIEQMISRAHLARSTSALAAVAALTGVAQANTQTFPFDLNGDGMTGTVTITRQVVNGVEVAEAKLEDATWGSLALVGLPSHGAKIVLCRTADFAGDGIRDLAVGLPGFEQRGIVAVFSGATINPGKKLSLADASRLFRSAFEDDRSFGMSLGVLPPVTTDAPVTLSADVNYLPWLIY